MPNPYDELFGPEPDPDKKTERKPSVPDPPTDPLAAYSFDPDSYEAGPDALDVVLERLQRFNEEAESFSKTLSRLKVVDHEVTGKITRIFLVSEDPHARASLAGERRYHEIQTLKFYQIIEPMRKLAQLHLATVKQFNREIDSHYFNPDKTDRQVEAEKKQAMDGINLQREILADAAGALKILREGLADTERRIRSYIDAGGQNNISKSEYELLVRKRETLTSGKEHHFNYSIFDVNLLDKTAFSLGIYLKETSTQYLDKLGKAMDL